VSVDANIVHIILAVKVLVVISVLLVRWRFNRNVRELHETVHRVYVPDEAEERMRFYSVWMEGWYRMPIVWERCHGPLELNRDLDPRCPRCGVVNT